MFLTPAGTMLEGMAWWRVIAVILGLGLIGGLWATAGALVSPTAPALGGVIHVGTSDSADQGSDDVVTESPTPPKAPPGGAEPVDSPQTCPVNQGNNSDDDCADPDDDEDDGHD